MIRIASNAILFALVPLSAQAQGAGKWEVKVAPAECSLVRVVQTPVPALLAVRTVPGTDEFIVLASGKDVPEGGKPEGFPARLSFDGGKPIDATATPLGKLAAGPALQLAPFKPAMLGAFAAARTVSVGSTSRNFASFDVPRAGEAIAALRKCVDDQLLEWGADPAQFAPGGTRPVALKDRDDWLTNDQLLKLAGASSGTNADYLFRVTIAPNGAIISCKREEAPANDPIEKLGCDPLVAQKLFTPAKNPAGTPVKGIAAFRVTLIRQAMATPPNAAQPR